MTGHETRTPSGEFPADMSLDRFAALVDAYGARPERWPATERPAALALLEVSAEARARRDEAAALDALLAESVVPAPAPALADAILARAPAQASALAKTRGRRSQPDRGLAARAALWLRQLLPEAADWRGAAALAASLLVGVAVGYLTPLADGGTAWTQAEQQAVDMFAFGGLASEDPSL
ncbi:MAG: hypothetical protein GVY13_10720 [Alphaproteobacteria bacterium]|jgi:hypothetical protein|nr:hypothetical protein [Alphaproteobacteria bacterium]